MGGFGIHAGKRAVAHAHSIRKRGVNLEWWTETAEGGDCEFCRVPDEENDEILEALAQGQLL